MRNFPKLQLLILLLLNQLSVGGGSCGENFEISHAIDMVIGLNIIAIDKYNYMIILF